MAYTHDGGGGGGSSYGTHTQRALLALIGSTALTNIRATRNMWEDTALKASTIADLVEARLDALTSPEGGWTGPGAESFKALVRKDLVENLRTYALRAAGVSKSGNANTGYAADLKPVEQQVDASYSTATHHNIPWDVDTQWRVDQEVPDQGLVSKIEEVVQGEDEDYEEAKKKAPYMILNGQSSTLKKVPQPEWEALEQSITPVQPPDVFTRAKVPVDAQVHRFDRLMEAQQMNDGVKTSVHTAASDVHGKLAAYQPQDLEEFTFTGGKLANGDQVTDHNGGAPAPGAGGQSPKPSPGGPGAPAPGPAPAPETPGPQDPTNPHPPGPPGEGITPGPGGPGGPGVPGPGPGGPGIPGPGPGGPEVPMPDPTDPTLPGGPGDGPGGYEDPGTGGAGVTPGAPGGPGVGGIGGPGAGGPAPSPTIGTGPGAPGAGGMGSLGVGGPVAAGGGAGTSFQLGANGRPMVNPGSVGPVAGANGASPGGGAGAGAGGAGGSGGAGGPMGRRTQGNDEEESGEEIDGTWLEEDESVWGSRAGAPPAEIR